MVTASEECFLRKGKWIGDLCREARGYQTVGRGPKTAQLRAAQDTACDISISEIVAEEQIRDKFGKVVARKWCPHQKRPMK